MSTDRCHTCEALRKAVGYALPDPMDVIAGLLEVLRERHGSKAADLVVVIGARGMGLPLEEETAGPFILGAMTRGELLAWAAASDNFEASLFTAPVAERPPPGRVHILAALGTRESGVVLMFNHDVPTPSAHAVAMARVSEIPQARGDA